MHTDRDKIAAALTRLYAARLDLLKLNELRSQVDYAAGSSAHSAISRVLDLRRLRQLFLPATAIYATAIAIAWFVWPTTASYWRSTVLAMLAVAMGALAWAFQAHDRRLRILVRQLTAGLETSELVRHEIEYVVEELENSLSVEGDDERAQRLVRDNDA